MLGGPPRSLVDSAASLDGEGMKLIRMGEIGQEKPGVLLEDGARLDVSGFGSDYDEARRFGAARIVCGAIGGADLPA